MPPKPVDLDKLERMYTVGLREIFLSEAYQNFPALAAELRQLRNCIRLIRESSDALARVQLVEASPLPTPEIDAQTAQQVIEDHAAQIGSVPRGKFFEGLVATCLQEWLEGDFASAVARMSKAQQVFDLAGDGFIAKEIANPILRREVPKGRL
jgi:hypothetical protein